LKNISLQFEQGKVTVLVGPNGCGKSTLLRVAARLMEPEAGCVLVEGRDGREVSQKEFARRVALLPQSRSVPEITVGALVLHGRFPYLTYPRRYRSEDHRIAREAMEQMDIADLAHRQMAELSGGMRQKVYIAMALAQQSPVILMDEPTTYLDVGQQLKFAEMAKALAKTGKTLILVLHDIPLALRISNQILIMEDGIISTQGTPRQILDSGALTRIYGIHVRSTDSPSGTQYYYEIP
jgi:iron complex transport system ATP-binding protein